ncbi:MAG: acyl carrier protein [Clostridia bacterium]|nr:acyl carrier protein [Clostridia bacterium]MBR2734964.1 acyl carrier protein [Clostridia bacterium]
MSSNKEFEEVFEKVRGIICENFGAQESDINLETNLYDDLDADSLDLVDLVSAVEYEFDIEATDDAVEKINTVEDVVNCVIDFMHAE